MTRLPFDEPATWGATDPGAAIIIRLDDGRKVEAVPAHDRPEAVFMHYGGRIRYAPSIGSALCMAGTFADETDALKGDA